LASGVRIDNGTGGSRVHVYIRGQGVLTESGFRGIGVLVDGITMNDPGGYAPDLYDIDWETVKNVEVVKGLAASMYGAGSTGGVINITTKEGGEKPVNGSFYSSVGSNGFWKTLGQFDGNKGSVNYRVSYSHLQGTGYRQHQAYKGDNFSEKLIWKPSDKLKVTQLLNYTSYFNQNSEGINLGRYDTVGYKAANTDAIPYNEFHKTQRLMGASIMNYSLSQNQVIQVKGFFKMNNYRETSNNGDDNKPFVNQGISAQYTIQTGNENFLNHLSIGADYQTKTMTEHMFAVDKDPNRVDTHFGESCLDKDIILINQIIHQKSAGFYLINKLDINKNLFVTFNARYDNVYSKLDSLSSSGSRTFDKPAFRIGLTYDLAKCANVYTSFGTGFLVPTEDELYNNPAAYGGFNSIIKPSTSMGFELGARGEVGNQFYYDFAAFTVNSKDEFYRYSVPGRGNNTAFFGNIGESKRYGIETYFAYSPTESINLAIAYTYSHFQYSNPDSVKNHWIPQCPQHMLSAEVAYKFIRHFTFTVNTQFQSKWCIQVDDSIYTNFTENGIKRSSWVNGFKIINANLKYDWKLVSLKGDISLFAKNLFDEHYFGFTEPNNGPDYNSFQPAPGRELFVSLRLRF
jgi:iron complex outermembrane receptor protein